MRTTLYLCLIILLLSCSDNQQPDKLVIENGKLKVVFNTENGALIGLEDLNNKYQFLQFDTIRELPWQINFHQNGDSQEIPELTPTEFNYSNPDPLSLKLVWGSFKELNNKELQVTASISLDEEKALSYWKISIEGIEENLIEDIVFPRISGIKDLEQEELAIPSWMGELLNNPRAILSKSTRDVKKMEWEYPGRLSLQLLALYNPDKVGLYIASNDTESYRKSFAFILEDADNLTYQMTNYPAFDASIKTYETEYEAVIGSFKGDWLTAAEQYREWGSKQEWATESRFKKGLTPSWVEETALWIWNRGRSENVLEPAADLKTRLGLPVNVFWHWWHGGQYDVTFPEYFPPREGKESFLEAMGSAKGRGLNSIVYMNALQWGNSAKSWETENASKYSVKDINGNMRSHSYNIFTGDSLTNMCVVTQFWKDKYSGLSDMAINDYGISGIYMDQACLTRMCYDPNHGHMRGGGNYWVKNFGKLTEQIRSKVSQDKQPILAGEGGGEGWMPYLDLFLTLQVSRERYGGVGNWETIPFFQAVYHQYAVTYGNYSSLVTPPYDELWPKEFAPENQEQALDSKFDKQFLMEQARSYVWGMQPTISNYHSFLVSEKKQEFDYLMRLSRVRYQGLKYLLYGKFLRTPDMEIPEEELNISKLSIYAGRKGRNVTAYKKEYPLVQAGTWEASDGNIGVALASISEETIPIEFKMDVNDYNLQTQGRVYVINDDGKQLLTTYNGDEVHVSYELLAREVSLIEIVSDQMK